MRLESDICVEKKNAHANDRTFQTKSVGLSNIHAFIFYLQKYLI